MRQIYIRLLFSAILFMVIGGIAVVGYNYRLPIYKVGDTIQPVNNSSSNLRPTLTSIDNKSLFMGNVFFGRYIDDWVVQSANPELAKLAKYQAKEADLRNYSYPFSGLDTFDRDKYDSWIAGLECPVTSGFISSFDQDDSLKFNCLPGYINQAAKWFDAFTLANNHIDNMQEFNGQPYNGFTKTKQELDKNNIQYFGHYDNVVRDDICEVVSLKAKANYSDGTKETVNIPVAMCGFHNVFKLPTQDQINMITEFAKYFPTIVMPHQGAEYVSRSDELKQETYRKFIDAGADIVVGDHPHATQEMEYYKGKMIVYSLGNFIFDQQYNSTVTNAIALDVETQIKSTNTILEAYLKIGENCSIFKDKCLNKAKELGLRKPELSFQFDIIASDNSNKLVKKASPEIQTKMEEITGIRKLVKP
jgi:hypothetical protein